MSTQENISDEIVKSVLDKIEQLIVQPPRLGAYEYDMAEENGEQIYETENLLEETLLPMQLKQIEKVLKSSEFFDGTEEEEEDSLIIRLRIDYVGSIFQYLLVKLDYKEFLLLAWSRLVVQKQ